MKTDTENKELLEACRIINTLDVTKFLIMIKEKFENWKKELNHGR